MTLYQQLSDRAERIVTRRNRLCLVLMFSGILIMVFSVATLVVILIYDAAISPVLTALKLAAVFAVGLGLCVLAKHFDNLSMADCLKQSMEALQTEAEIAEFAMHAPALYSEEAFARITDEARLTALALEALSDEVREAAAKRLTTPEVRCAVACATHDDMVAIITMRELDTDRLVRIADTSPLLMIRLDAAHAASDSARILRELDRSPSADGVSSIIARLTAPEDLAAAAVRLADDAQCLAAAGRCALEQLGAQQAGELAARLYAVLTRAEPQKGAQVEAARLLKALYTASTYGGKAVAGYTGTRYHALFDKDDHTDSHSDETTSSCHSVDDYCYDEHSDTHTDEHLWSEKREERTFQPE